MVYHGPSAGCKACRMRRVKCDQGKPSCNNCIRRRTVCPGYGDVFDGAHRNQNKVVIRKVKKQNVAEEADPASSTPGSDLTAEISPGTTSTASNDSATTKPQGPLQWIIYSATPEERGGSHGKALQLGKSRPARSSETEQTVPLLSIPESLKQSPEDASINFFFRFYTGTIYDPHLHHSFALLWQPLYLRSSANSPLRLATAAVTVNITMMWSFQGCDARPARKLFTEAIAATREAINNPTEKNMDELLMTILIFDLYDSLVLHYVRNAPTKYGKHKDGALALVKHRGLSNYASIVGRALTNATRHNFLDYSLSHRIPMPAGSEEIFSHPAIGESRAAQLDVLTIETVNTQARLWALRRDASSTMTRAQRRKAYEDIIADAIRIDELFMTWKRAITSPDWLPLFVSREEVPPSILTAGFYGTKCAVWKDLAAAEVYNLHASRRISVLQMIRQSLADEPTLLAEANYRAYLAKANAAVQSLVDCICETVPFHLGDTVVPTNPMYSSGVAMPSKTVTDPSTGETRRIPDLEGSDFKMRAAASGGWMIFSHLVDIYRLAEPEDDAESIVLRDGQLEWVKGQIKRLQTTFLYCDPLW
ncbi:hypothetical protein G647_06868 [Cladophialophora carrionii CBS 160.54]|uniref:Zn(2)-C6 fungal-type domain-containing protein n=1 Tax=Cladophialophora carrionii CBS 160.54 TaxID=1279043 RepID=V9DA08_9EURO|nr:uncharacterized protein G647_06868 [Cladophialophora carrionii CBS 160.54]ETI22792.1 hypothetical protein G647_06868 [Cladophialophora carrionii CBS 160.54]